VGKGPGNNKTKLGGRTISKRGGTGGPTAYEFNRPGGFPFDEPGNFSWVPKKAGFLFG